jgi:3-phenylpropionate/cinnamic acid dioxygenase small subunit
MLNRSTADGEAASLASPTGEARRIPSGSEIYCRLTDTLFDEAAFLDNRQFADWAAMLADDLRYTAPIRLTRTGPFRDRDVMRTMMHFNEDRTSILQRIGRFDKNCAWAEDPPSRTRRFVGNIRVFECEAPGEYQVFSNLYVRRSRGDSPSCEEVTAQRQDLWRHIGDGYRLARREIIVDQSVLSMSNFAIFL